MFISPKAPADGFLPFRKTQGLTEQGLEAPFFLLCHFYLSGERFHPFEIRQICRHVHNASVFIYFILFLSRVVFGFSPIGFQNRRNKDGSRQRRSHAVAGGGSDAASPPRARCDSRNTRHFLITAIRMHPFRFFPPTLSFFSPPLPFVSSPRSSCFPPSHLLSL